MVVAVCNQEKLLVGPSPITNFRFGLRLQLYLELLHAPQQERHGGPVRGVVGETVGEEPQLGARLVQRVRQARPQPPLHRKAENLECVDGRGVRARAADLLTQIRVVPQFLLEQNLHDGGAEAPDVRLEVGVVGGVEEELWRQLHVEDVGPGVEVLDAAVAGAPRHVLQPLLHLRRPQPRPHSLPVNHDILLYKQ